jgi:phosphate-selective porin
MVDLRDHDIGSEAAFTLLGINYYPSPRIKLMANIIFPKMSGNSINNDQSGQAYSLRIQYKF